MRYSASIKYFSVLTVFLLVSSFTRLHPENTAFKSWIDVEIIQLRTSQYAIQGESKSPLQVTIFNQNQEEILNSGTLVDDIYWKFETYTWETGNYIVVVESSRNTYITSKSIYISN